MNANLLQGQLTQRFAGVRTQQRSARPSQICKAYEGKIGTWLPGQEHPKHLDGSLPGDYGFDPLSLGVNPPDLQRYRVAELINGRWAMLGAAGAMVQEITGQGNWFDAPKWAITGGSPTYLGFPIPFNLPALVGIEAVAIAFVEMQRLYETDPEKQAYPGGQFDPLGFSKNAQTFRKFQVNEVKNGRLAMIACVGFAFQHAVYGNGLFDNLFDHIKDPTGKNFATNGISLPQFT